MSTKKVERTSGRSKLVLEAVLKIFKPGEQFHSTSFEVPGLKPEQVGSSLCLLAKKGLVEHGPLKGYYRLPNGATASVNPAQTIYDLLEYMAKAEPHMRRAAKILEAAEKPE